VSTPEPLSGEPPLPGVREVDDALAAELATALEAKGDTYRPRTHHLEASGAPTYTNRLIRETSPYLLQHAHNPVSWYPWGEEAFARARERGVPVFLSVGYSTCHWCHVMERESFEDVEIATYLNEHFVAIKVDREERPDIDEIYMTAVQMMTRRGGWPMTVVMTPEGEPFFGGTYFPARDGDRGAPRGFLSILQQLARVYAEEPDRVVASAREISRHIQEATAPRPPGDVPAAALIERAARQIEGGFDPEWGGFGRAPKFPQPSRIDLVLRHAWRSDDSEVREMVATTLTKMASGGLFDQVGGGFHRYSTDRRWLVPHFEKMLYDNAQLVSSYLDAAQLTGRVDFREVARRTLDYVAREMTSPSGGFYSATDADSPDPEDPSRQEEGLFFTWTEAELREVLGEDAPIAEALYGIEASGNFEGRSIPTRWSAEREVASALEMDLDALRDAELRIRGRLYDARRERLPPLRDEKILTSWNGLMISAFARGALVLGDEAYTAQAERAARFLLESHRDGEGRLLRSSLDGEAGRRAFLTDYAFLVGGLLDLAEVAGPSWVGEARRLQEELDAHFAAEGGGYWMTADDAEALLTREKPGSDGAVPSGNSVALRNLLRLWALTGEERYRAAATDLLRAFATELERFAPGMTRMLGGLDAYHGVIREVVVVESEPGAGDPLMAVLQRTFLPDRVVIRVAADEVERAAEEVPLLEGKGVLRGRATAFVCERGRCELPTDDPAVFEEQLRRGS